MIELEIHLRDSRDINDIRAALGEYLGCYLDAQSRRRRDAVRIVSVADEDGDTQIPVEEWLMDPLAFDERLEWVRDVFIMTERFRVVFEVRRDRHTMRRAELSLDYERACYKISGEDHEDENQVFWRFTGGEPARIYDDLVYGRSDRNYWPATLDNLHVRCFAFSKVYHEGREYMTTTAYKMDQRRAPQPHIDQSEPRERFFKSSGYDYTALMKADDGWERWRVLWRPEGIIDDSGRVAVSRVSEDGSVVERDLVAADRLWRPDDWRAVKAACDAATDCFPGDTCDCGYWIEEAESERAYTLGRLRFGDHQGSRNQDKGRVDWIWHCPNCLRKGYTIGEFDLPVYAGEPAEQYDGPLTAPRR